MLRNSEKSTFDKCRFAWSVSYGRGLQAQVGAPALRLGTLIHKALAGYYVPGVKRGVHPAKTFELEYEIEVASAYSFGWKDEDGTWQDAGELGVAMMNHYVEHYGKDDQWKVIATEQPFSVMVYHPDSYDPNHPPEAQKTARPWFKYAGILDGIWQDRSDNSLWIPDHKTTAGIGGSTGSHLRMDDQAGGYWCYGVEWLREQGILKPNQKLAGMLYNFIRKAAKDPRPTDAQGRALNKDGTVSQKQPSPYFLRQPIHRDEADRENFKQRIVEMVHERELVRSGELTARKSPGQFNCPTCWVYDACEIHEVQGDWEMVLSAISQPWDPYAEHEIRAGEQR